MNYRIMEEADIPQAAAFYMEYYNRYEEGAWTLETTARRIRQVLTREDSYCLLLEEAGEVIAFAMGYFEQYDDGFAYDLVEIVVKRGRQNAGLGTALMKELESRVKAQGAMLVQLQAVADERHERFYSRLGYGTARNFVLKTKLLF